MSSTDRVAAVKHDLSVSVVDCRLKMPRFPSRPTDRLTRHENRCWLPRLFSTHFIIKASRHNDHRRIGLRFSWNMFRQSARPISSPRLRELVTVFCTINFFHSCPFCSLYLCRSLGELPGMKSGCMVVLKLFKTEHG